MQVTRNDWTPLFESLKAKISPASRRSLMASLIGEIQDITQKTMGRNGENRPEPWAILNEKYAKEWKYGDTEPTLLMSDEKHNLRNPDLPHLIDLFYATFSENSSSLTNTSPYADIHQLGLGVAKRPYYPVLGNDLTPYAIDKLKEVLDLHFQVCKAEI